MDIEDLSVGDLDSAAERQLQDYLSRRAKARLYADHNFPQPAVRLLREAGARVQTARQVGLAGRADEDHAAYALAQGLVLITCDRDFLNDRRFPLIHSPAIFVFDFRSGSERDMKQAFGCLVQVFQAPQFFDKWCKVDASPDSWTQWQRFQDGTTSRWRSRYWRGRLQEWIDEV